MQEFIGKRVKCKFNDEGSTKVVTGVFERSDSFGVYIRGDLNDKIVYIGLPQIVLLREDERGNNP